MFAVNSVEAAKLYYQELRNPFDPVRMKQKLLIFCRIQLDLDVYKRQECACLLPHWLYTLTSKRTPNSSYQ